MVRIMVILPSECEVYPISSTRWQLLTLWRSQVIDNMVLAYFDGLNGGYETTSVNLQSHITYDIRKNIYQ